MLRNNFILGEIFGQVKVRLENTRPLPASQVIFEPGYHSADQRRQGDQENHLQAKKNNSH
jgi:hypothetical protein